MIFYRAVINLESVDNTSKSIRSSNCISQNIGFSDEDIPVKSDVLKYYDQRLLDFNSERDQISHINPNVQTWAFSSIEDSISYALSKNNKSFLIIKFETEIDNVAIDARDGLFFVFQYIDMNNRQNINYGKKLKRIYGNKVIQCLKKINNQKMMYRLLAADRYVLLDDSIKTHYKNKQIVEAKYDMFFKGAFQILNPRKVIIKDIIVDRDIHNLNQYSKKYKNTFKITEFKR